MLGLSHATEINDLWDKIESKASLPTTPEEFFGKSGLKALEEHRAFVRHYLRCQGILQRERETHAIYMKDCSRVGMGLISPVQLFPRERIQIWMKPQRNYTLEVIRCRRIRVNCYECGTIFILK
ncbi:MAG: hypothetical protein GXP24_08030 [Planctomycetes bacterium]|nr:hypothetical protein [Planctomycetota bacterium]